MRLKLTTKAQRHKVSKRGGVGSDFNRWARGGDAAAPPPPDWDTVKLPVVRFSALRLCVFVV
jgi:hypothetical protein